MARQRPQVAVGSERLADLEIFGLETFDRVNFRRCDRPAAKI